MSELFVFPQPAEYWQGTMSDLMQATRMHPDKETPRHIPTLPCPQCTVIATVPMTVMQFVEYFYIPKKDRRNIQEIFPELSRSERERLMTGYCDECWEAMFK